jgi:hypothetical protein
MVIGKEAANNRVERSFFQRATGYEHRAVKIIKGDNNEPIYAEHVPADPACAMNWLSNRLPEKWRDKTEVGTQAPRRAMRAFVGTIAITTSPNSLTRGFWPSSHRE